MKHLEWPHSAWPDATRSNSLHMFLYTAYTMQPSWCNQGSKPGDNTPFSVIKKLLSLASSRGAVYKRVNITSIDNSYKNLENGDKRPVKRVEVLAVARTLVGHHLTARADVLVVDMSAELAAEQVHP